MSLFVDQDEDPASQPPESIHPISFTASTNQIIHLADILSSITTINANATISIKQDGITIYASYNHITNVHVTIDPSLFSYYNLSGPEDAELRLGVDINLIAECFNSVTSSITKRDSKRDKNNVVSVGETVICLLNYQGEGYPLVVEFEDNLISEKLEFLTFYIDDENDEGMAVSHDDIDMELIVKSDVLSNLLQDLHQINTQDLYIYASVKNESKQLRFISTGPIGTSKLIFPNEKTILEKVSLSGDSQFIISKFDFVNFFKIFRAVKYSFKCKMLKDREGRFSIQLLCKNAYMANYSGTLMQFNMLEVNHDEYMLHNILQEEADEEEAPNEAPTISMNMDMDFGPSSYNGVDVQRTIYDEDGAAQKRQRAQQEQVRNVGGAVEIPLFL
ncbi:uncharacterized protein SPAPADRAFT_155788 [Spathaspora passalidarum NRRL Y-27907]|uniref:DNA damage checkpoint control protein RAD17 n=1 Tax=Spathaspora passalidarum (strain NRRL Y-27907 / 11-Y1) TaxID=619300 RepID=G3ASJ6_SPAPN|nr:uncharacterized protein SPAPADRAFT_155788 [Spathaspora passalidarum NRRL Y-27907]EGW30682.1 hypothetical protein SPAPADRAFT_155788 [Spathaspora passalidarum NRRL Y-27907]